MGRKKDSKYDLAYQLYLDGLSLSQVAKELNVTRQCVFKAFKKRHLHLRGYVWENEKGKIPEGWDIHHINNDKADNRISNLECLSKSEHTKKYSPHNNKYTKGRKK